MKNWKLSNGCSMPIVAFGTYNRDLDRVPRMVSDAIDIGYRHFDTAFLYRNEEKVGQAISERQPQIARHELFVTSKLPPNGMASDRVEHFLDLSLKHLKTDYLDLYLMHAPFASKYVSDDEFYPLDENGVLIADNETDFVDTWRRLEELHKRGKVKAIGVSNFNANQLQRILDSCEIRPMVNQVEAHVYFQNKELIAFCQKNQIQVSAFAPLATPLFCPPDYLLAENETIRKLSKKHGKTWAQIALRFLTQQAVAVVPAADDRTQLLENLDCNSFELSDEEMRLVGELNKRKRIYVHAYVNGITEHKDYPFKDDDNYNGTTR